MNKKEKIGKLKTLCDLLGYKMEVTGKNTIRVYAKEKEKSMIIGSSILEYANLMLVCVSVDKKTGLVYALFLV